jgi:hypothetical protein
MKRSKSYVLSVVAAAALSWFLCSVYVMPEFTLLASPGVMLGLMAAGNTPENNNAIIFVGNWLFYSLVFALLTEIVRIFRKAKSL